MFAGHSDLMGKQQAKAGSVTIHIKLCALRIQNQ
uniref:Uncharacterized protein n=1 Tax=Anguilla anguilla TaxID=7936 RepID=A0A0E9XXJ3_ANGAN